MARDESSSTVLVYSSVIIVAGKIYVRPSDPEAYPGEAFRRSKLATRAEGCLDFHLSAASRIDPGRITPSATVAHCRRCRGLPWKWTIGRPTAAILDAAVFQHDVASSERLHTPRRYRTRRPLAIGRHSRTGLVQAEDRMAAAERLQDTPRSQVRRSGGRACRPSGRRCCVAGRGLASWTETESAEDSLPRRRIARLTGNYKVVARRLRASRRGRGSQRYPNSGRGVTSPSESLDRPSGRTVSGAPRPLYVVSCGRDVADGLEPVSS